MSPAPRRGRSGTNAEVSMVLVKKRMMMKEEKGDKEGQLYTHTTARGIDTRSQESGDKVQGWLSVER